jgi:hypothetical protein
LTPVLLGTSSCDSLTGVIHTEEIGSAETAIAATGTNKCVWVTWNVRGRRAVVVVALRYHSDKSVKNEAEYGMDRGID